MTNITAFRQEVTQTFRSLRYPNFRLYFAGQAISLCGTWMQSVALGWLIYRLTHSPSALGIVEAANTLPMLLFGLYGGSVADRFDRRKVLLCTQTLAMMQAIVLASLTITNQLQVWHAVVLAALLGTVSAFEVPSRQAFIVQMVDRENLVNAISLNSSLLNGSRTVAPALAALIVWRWSESVCFVLNAISFLAALIAIFAIRIDRQKTEHGEPQSTHIMEAVHFIKARPSLRRVVVLAVVMTLFGVQYSVLMPIFASEVLKGEVRLFGVLRSFAGAGALIAALTLANRADGAFLKKAIGYASVLFSVALFFFGMSRNVALSCALVLLCGLSQTTQLSGGHSLTQLAVPDRLRGRVMSIYMMVVRGLVPIGAFLVGTTAQHWGAPLTVSTCSIVCLIAGLIYLWGERRQQSDINL